MTVRRSYLLVVLAVFAVGLATRAVPLYWSPLPATLDGFGYAALAADAIAGSHFQFARMDADEIFFTAALTAASTVTGTTPLKLAQPLVVVTGGASGLIAVALVRRVGAERGWGRSSRYVRVAAAFAGLLLAVDGIYLWRTGVPDEEAFGLLLVPLLALAVHRLLGSRRLGWGVAALVLLVVFPPLHNLSSMIAALTLTALGMLHLVHTPNRPTAILALGFVGGFWSYFVGFFEAAARFGLNITYSGLLRGSLGLFFAWIVVLAIGAVWFGGARPGIQRGAFAFPIVTGFILVIANTVTPVFPGTISTPLPVLVMVLGFTVPVAFAAGSAPALSANRPTGLLLLALLAAPVVMTFYALTASLTPAFFDTVIRVQTFGHVPVFVLAGLASGRAVSGSISGPGIAERVPGYGTLGVIAVGLLVVGTAVTMPLAYLDVDTVTYPSTVTPSEFQAATFATTHLHGQYATDTNQARIAAHYFERSGRPVVNPTRAWLTDGVPPACPVLSRHGWMTTGAHLYPTNPQTIATTLYETFLMNRNLVYTSNGLDPFVVTRPPASNRTGC